MGCYSSRIRAELISISLGGLFVRPALLGFRLNDQLADFFDAPHIVGEAGLHGRGDAQRLLRKYVGDKRNVGTEGMTAHRYRVYRSFMADKITFMLARIASKSS